MVSVNTDKLGIACSEFFALLLKGTTITFTFGWGGGNHEFEDPIFSSPYGVCGHRFPNLYCQLPRN